MDFGISDVELRNGRARTTDAEETEDRGQRTEDRGQRTEDRGQRTEDRGQEGVVRTSVTLLGQDMGNTLLFIGYTSLV